MLKDPIYITAISSISSLGSSYEEKWSAYNSEEHCLSKIEIGGQSVWVGSLDKTVQHDIEKLRHSNSKYKNLDASVLYSVYASQKAVEEAGWNEDSNFGINIGSSRGATDLFEKYHQQYLESSSTSTLASPTTTLGNISSWVAHDLKTKGPEISHSITCSTSLHALLNAVAWLQAGLADTFLVGGSEAPLTPFTIAQMQALKIYSKAAEGNEKCHPEPLEGHPCRALDFEKKKNTMVLGEGASMACLQRTPPKNSLALVAGIGYATEPLTHNVSISTDAKCFQESMKMALSSLAPSKVDGIVMHAPGTVKGDISELEAIKKVFGKEVPALTSNKWKLGHTLGASGMLSIEMATMMMQQQEFIPVPFYQQDEPNQIDHILVNAVGFGGNAVSILLRNPKCN